MDKITKPNDILVATLQAPNASTLDLMLNNITADNTSLLTIEEYKNTPLVKKVFSDENGVFNEDAFNNMYLQAYLKYAELSDEEAYKNMEAELEYSPVDRFRPIEGKVKNVSAEYEHLKNPMQQEFGIEGINVISEPTKTKKEIALGNPIYDPETGKFLEESPEDLSILDKLAGRTLIYAKWNEDGYHIDPITGEEIKHFKGEWKTNEEGSYYTEYIGKEDLGTNEVVSIQDILTKEDSLWNKIDFYDADGKEKSIFGTTMKLASAIIPYFIPVIGDYYAAFTTFMGLAEVLPTFFKAAEDLVCGVEDLSSHTRDVATRMENWFRKWEPSRSEEAMENFWGLESMANLVGTTVTQLFLQTTAAKAVKYIGKKAPALVGSFSSEQAYQTWLKEQNRMQSMLSLGYMGLTSAANTYNDALNAGYDKRTAGFTALMSAASLFGIMQFNATANNIGTWFLNKNLHFNTNLAAGAIRHSIKSKFKDMSSGFKALSKGNSRPLRETLSDFKRDVWNLYDDITKVHAKNFIQGSLVEGIEEVSEEVILDTVKGMVDFASYMGWTGKEGSFGGWNNVFSKRGLERYIQTFVGGTIGGALFLGAGKAKKSIDSWWTGKEIPKDVVYDFYKIVRDGRANEARETIKDVKKFFNTKLSADIVLVGDDFVYAKATEGNSLADLIADQMLLLLDTIENLVLRENTFNKYDKNDTRYGAAVELYSNLLRLSGLEEMIVEDWTEDNNIYLDKKMEVVRLRKSLDTEGTDKKQAEEELKLAEEELTKLEEDQRNWYNGKRFLDYNGMGLLMVHPTLSGLLSLNINNFAKIVYGEDNFDSLSENRKKEIQTDFDLYNLRLSSNNKKEFRQSIRRKLDVYKKIIPLFTKAIKEVTDLKDYTAYLTMLSSLIVNEDGTINIDDPELDIAQYVNLSEFLAANPKNMNLNDRIKFDIAKHLVDNGLITIDTSLFDKDKLDVRLEEEENEDPEEAIRNIINNIAAYSRIVIWDSANIKALIQQVEAVVNDTSKSSNIDKYIIRKYLPDGLDLSLKLDINKLSSLDPTKIPPMQATFSSILEAVKDLKIVDKRLMDVVDFIYERELVDKYKEVIKKFYNTSDGEGPVIDYLRNPSQTYYINKQSGLVDTNITSPTTGYIEISDNSEEADLLFSAAHVNSLTTLNEVLLLVSIINQILLLEGVPLLLNAETLVPKELDDAYLAVKKKEVKTSPLVDIIYNMMHKIGSNADKTIVEWLIEKSDEIRSGTIDIAKKVDKQVLEDLLNVLQFLQVIAMQATPQVIRLLEDKEGNVDIGVTTLNSIFKSYVLLYGTNREGIKDLADDYVLFSEEEVSPFLLELFNLDELIQFIRTIHHSYSLVDLTHDRLCREVFNKTLAKRLENDSLDFGNGLIFKFPPKKVDADIEDEEYLAVAMLELYSYLKANSIDNKTLHKVINNKYKGLLKKDFNDKTYYTDAINVETSTVDDSLIREFIIVSTAIEPKELYSLYLKGVEGLTVLPLFDQELAIRYAIASLINPEHFKGDTKDVLSLTFLSGSAGSGKTTIGNIVLNALDGISINNETYQFILSATSEIKTKDLANNSTLKEKTSSTVRELIPGFGNDWFDSIKNVLESTVKNNKTEGSILVGSLNLDFKFKLNAKDIISVYFTETAKENLKAYFIKNSHADKFKNKIVLIDEATHLDPLYLEILNILNECFNTRFLLLGDLYLAGFYFEQKDVIEFFNITRKNTLRTHRLSGIFRASNSAVYDNMKSLGNISLNISKYDGEEEYVVGDVARFLSDFSTINLKYSQNLGHRITNDKDEFNALFKLLRQGVPTLVIVDNNISEDEKQQIRTSLGTAPNLKVLNLKDVLGAEADNVIVYNLLSISPNDYMNSDIDVKNFYTAASRAKNYTLIYEESEKTGLFSRYNIKSEEDDNIVVSVVNDRAKIWERNLLHRKEKINTILKILLPKPLNNIPGQENPTQEGQTPSTGTSSILTLPQLSSTNPLVSDAEKLKDLQLQQKLAEEAAKKQEEKDKRVTIEERFGEDVAIVATSYVRIGISKEDLELLKGNDILVDGSPLTIGHLRQYLKGENTGLFDSLSFEEKDKAEELMKTIASDNSDFSAFIKHFNGYDSFEGKTIEQALDIYRRFINSLLYKKITPDSLCICGKELLPTVDYWYEKPNDNPTNPGPTLVTFNAKIDNNYYTLGLVEFLGDTNLIQSSTIKSYRERILAERLGNMTEFLDLGTINLYQEEASEYYNDRKVPTKSVIRNHSEFVSVLIPETAARTFRVDHGTKYTGRMTRLELVKTGFELNTAKIPGINKKEDLYDLVLPEYSYSTVNRSLPYDERNSYYGVSPVLLPGYSISTVWHGVALPRLIYHDTLYNYLMLQCSKEGIKRTKKDKTNYVWDAFKVLSAYFKIDKENLELQAWVEKVNESLGADIFTLNQKGYIKRNEAVPLNTVENILGKGTEGYAFVYEGTGTNEVLEYAYENPLALLPLTKYLEKPQNKQADVTLITDFNNPIDEGNGNIPVPDNDGFTEPLILSDNESSIINIEEEVSEEGSIEGGNSTMNSLFEDTSTYNTSNDLNITDPDESKCSTFNIPDLEY